MRWLVVYYSGYQEIIEAEDFDELHAKVNSDDVVVVIKLNNDVYAESK